MGKFKPRNFVYFFFFFFVKDQKTGVITGWSKRKKLENFCFKTEIKV